MGSGRAGLAHMCHCGITRDKVAQVDALLVGSGRVPDRFGQVDDQLWSETGLHQLRRRFRTCCRGGSSILAP